MNNIRHLDRLKKPPSGFNSIDSHGQQNSHYVKINNLFGKESNQSQASLEQNTGQIPYVSRGSSRASFDNNNSLPDQNDEAFLNDWVNYNQLKLDNIED